MRYASARRLRTVALSLGVALAWTVGLTGTASASAITTQCGAFSVTWNLSGSTSISFRNQTVNKTVDPGSASYAETTTFNCVDEFDVTAPLGATLTWSATLPLAYGPQGHSIFHSLRFRAGLVSNIFFAACEQPPSSSSNDLMCEFGQLGGMNTSQLDKASTLSLAWVRNPYNPNEYRVPNEQRVDGSIVFHVTAGSAPPAGIAPAESGGPGANRWTKFLGGSGPGSKCSKQGLPNYFVNMANLNLVVEDTDFRYQGLGPEIAFTRTYNLDPTHKGLFGKGWSATYEGRVTQSGGLAAAVSVAGGSGQVLSYAYASSSASGGVQTAVYTPPAGNHDALTASTTGSSTYYQLRKKDSRNVYRYDVDPTLAGSFRLTSITDRNGNAVTVGYNADGTLASVTDAAGRATTFTYNAQKLASRMTTPDSGEVTYSYDAGGNLIGTVDLLDTAIAYTYDGGNFMTGLSAGGRSVGFAYDESGGWKHVARVTDGNGHVTQYAGIAAGSTTVTEPGGGITSYTSSGGRSTSVRNALNQTTSTTYNAQSLPSAVTDARGLTTAFVYDAGGNLTKVTDSAGKATALVYDARSNLTGITDALGQTTIYAYDARDNLTGTTTPLGRTTGFALDAKGQITQVSRPDGKVTAVTYDSRGNLTGITDPLGNNSSFGFDAQGLNRTLATDSLGRVTGYSYDANRRLTAITRADGTKVEYCYDCCALTSVKNGAGNTTTFQTDALLNLTGITDPLGNIARLTYNADGEAIAAVGPSGQTTSFTYDKAHRPVSIINPLGGTVAFGRDATGALTTLTDERGKVSTQTLDNRGLLASRRDPLNQTTAAYIRDALGRVTALTKARGNVIAWTYDTDNRVTGKKYDGTAAASYAWNVNGDLTSVTDPTGSKTFSYDAARQLTAIGYPDGRTTVIGYDAAGNVASMTYGDGLVVTYTYDVRNRVTGVSFAGNSMTLAYDGSDRLVGETRSSGMASIYGYDTAGRLTRVAHGKGATVVADVSYTRNAAGQIAQESGTWPVSPVLAAVSDTATYDNANAVATWGGDSMTRDADGNLTAVGGARSFSATFDPENRLTSITRSGSTTTYTYDGLGFRVQGQTGAASRRFYHDARGGLLYDRDVATSAITHYIYAGGRLVAFGSSAGGYYFFHFDKTGSTLALTDSGGSVVGAFAYDAYGKVIARSGSVTTPFKYVGAYGVSENTGDLYFMRHRYYDPATGQFLQRDPIGFGGGMNLYRYVEGNPVTGIDPSGLDGLGSNPDFNLNGFAFTPYVVAAFKPDPPSSEPPSSEPPTSAADFALLNGFVPYVVAFSQGMHDQYKDVLNVPAKLQEAGSSVSQTVDLFTTSNDPVIKIIDYSMNFVER